MTRKQFEYTWAMIPPSDDPCKELNALGREGWELVSVLPDNADNYGVFYLKREVEPFGDRD